MGERVSAQKLLVQQPESWKESESPVARASSHRSLFPLESPSLRAPPHGFQKPFLTIVAVGPAFSSHPPRLLEKPWRLTLASCGA